MSGVKLDINIIIENFHITTIIVMLVHYDIHHYAHAPFGPPTLEN